MDKINILDMSLLTLTNISRTGEESFALIHNWIYAIVQFGPLIFKNRHCNHVSGGSAMFAQRFFGWNEHVRNILY